MSNKTYTFGQRLAAGSGLGLLAVIALSSMGAVIWGDFIAGEQIARYIWQDGELGFIPFTILFLAEMFALLGFSDPSCFFDGKTVAKTKCSDAVAIPKRRYKTRTKVNSKGVVQLSKLDILKSIPSGNSYTFAVVPERVAPLVSTYGKQSGKKFTVRGNSNGTSTVYRLS